MTLFAVCLCLTLGVAVAVHWMDDARDLRERTATPEAWAKGREMLHR